MRFNTSLLHGGYALEERTGATAVPVYQSSAFAHSTAEELESVFRGTEFGYVYSRLNNPTVQAFEQRVAHLEGGQGAVACASGMAAITLAVLNIAQSGDEILCAGGLFGGTFSLFAELSRFGIEAKHSGSHEPESVQVAIRPNTRLIFVETIGNPKLDVADIRALADLAHRDGIPLVVDNTVTTPYMVRPLELGADIVIHSTSKFINGSGNSIGGIIVDGGRFTWDPDKFTALRDYKKFGPMKYLVKLRQGLAKDFGACISPFNAYLNTLGLDTLGVRMERLCANAAKLAAFLQTHPRVQAVNYPGLPEHPDHALAAQQFDERYGAILTLRTGSKEAAFKLINSLRYAVNIANIGDTRTLVIHPASTIYIHNTPAEKEMLGVPEDLIRISVGLEDIDDLIEDFDQAIAKL